MAEKKSKKTSVAKPVKDSIEEINKIMEKKNFGKSMLQKIIEGIETNCTPADEKKKKTK